MKKIALIASTAIASAALNAAPLFTIGDQVDVFFKGAVMGKWDSNMYLKSENKIDDYSYTFRLGLDANYGRNSRFKANVRFYEDLVRYVVRTDSNSNLANVFANASYTEERWSVLTSFSFRQLAQNTESMDLGNQDFLIRRDVYEASIKGTYDFTDKLNGEVGFSWYREDFRDNPLINKPNPGDPDEWAYSNRDTFSVPVSLLYRVTEKINAGLTYQYRTTEYSKGNSNTNSFYGNDIDDHFVGVTVRGEIFPKLSTETSLGYAFRDMPQYDSGEGKDEGTFSFSSRFDYLVTEKLSVFATGFRDFGNGAARQSMLNTGTRVGANYALSEYVKIFGAFGYTNSEYKLTGRDDDWFSYHAGITYTPNRYFTIGATYDYYDNQSNVDVSSYTRHLVGVSVELRY